ncbi:9244_t:CDS:1, partial [Racocetra fulgida]
MFTHQSIKNIEIDPNIRTLSNNFVNEHQSKESLDISDLLKRKRVDGHDQEFVTISDEDICENNKETKVRSNVNKYEKNHKIIKK